MAKKDIEDVYPLTPLQEGLLFHTILSPADGAYHDQFSAVLRGPLDDAALLRAWRTVTASHAIFRTAFAWQTGKAPLQVVGRTVEAPAVQLDWRATEAAGRERLKRELIADDARRGFDPAKAPLMRLTLARTEDDAWFLLWSRHHLLLDGWSLAHVMREWLAAYQALRAGRPVAPTQARPFRDYLAWLQRQDAARAEAFWRAELGDFSQPTPLGLALPPESPAPAAGERHGELTLALSAGETEALRALARQSRVTLATVFQGAWALLLARFGGERDVVFGNTVSGRPPDLPGAETMVGLFINTLPLRARIAPAATLGEWLRALQARVMAAREFEFTPLVKIHGWTEVARDRPLFETLLVFENYPVDEALAGGLGELRVEDTHSHERTHYPATMIVAPGTAITLVMLHDRARLPDEWATRWLGYFRALLAACAVGPEQAVGGLHGLVGEERARATAQPAELAHDRTASLHGLVAAQVARSPGAVAMVDGVRRLTYTELAAASDRLASHLRTLGAGPELCVGVCLERGADLVIALLAVLKAGAAYVPLDPAYPADRLAFMAGDARFVALITQRRVADRLPTLAIPTVWLDEPLPVVAGAPAAVRVVMPAHLAYLIYTSGSTGRPKGTAIEHRQAVAFVHWAQTVFTPRELAGVLFSTSVCFDLSIFELFVTLASGGKVIVAENALALPALPARGEVTLVNTVPSAAAELVRLAGIPASVMTVNLAGEPLTAALADKLYAQPTIERVFDLYGPSEDTTYSTCALRARGGPATIGRVIANSRLYLLDPDLQPVPLGAIGELWLAGEGLARGYLGRPDLTAERFLPDPFAREPGGRLYRTGDLARFREDGQIEFLGRGDHQVKIRGFRIELGEIQARLEAHPDVAEAAVLAREHPQRGPYIVAFVSAGAAVGTAGLAEWARATLPHYMVPTAWHRVPALPRTPNGKLDRKALPADRDGPDEPPATPSFRLMVADPLTELVAGIWAEVLGIPTPEPGVNFFDLGGHSLLATQVVARVRAAIGRDVPLRCLFDHPVLRDFVAALSAVGEGSTDDAGPISALPRDASPVLSYAQERMWVLAQLAPGSPAYNLPAAFELTGALDVKALQRALNAVVARHEPLRSVFPAAGGRATLRIEPELTLALPVTDLSTRPEAACEAEAHRLAAEEARTPFELTTGPLIRAALLRLAPDRHWVLFTVHHIISDGWSEGVLVDEVMKAYAGGSLDGLAVTYGDFARWQRSRQHGPAWMRQADYWRAQLAGVEPLVLPTDRERPAVPAYRGGQVECGLDPALTAAVTALGRKEGATLFMTLLAAWQTLLAKQSGQEDFAIGTPVAGRTRREVESVIGLFVNTLALRADLKGDPTFRDLIRRVRKTTLDAFANQELPFDQVIEAVNPERDASRAALFQVMFSLQNQPAAVLTLAGLSLRPVVVEAKQAKFDLTIFARETSRGLVVTAEYDSDLYNAAAIGRMLARYSALLAEVVKDPARRLSALGGLAPEERELVVHGFNANALAHDRTLRVHDGFERRARMHPEKVALVDGSRRLTYAELDARANAWAARLRTMGAGPERLVGVCLERSADLVTALFAVLKTGAAYVPLDPAYPADRLAYMCEDSATRLLISRPALAARLPAGPWTVVDAADLAALAPEPVAGPCPARPENLAYLIYTSGSTGRPKASAIEHRSTVALIAWARAIFPADELDGVLFSTSICFDLSVFELFATLALGGKVILAENVLALPGIPARGEVRFINTVPSAINEIVRNGWVPPGVRVALLAGEALPASLADRIYATGTVAKVYDCYGPSEDTTYSTWTLREPGGPATIGRAMANTQLYVLDPHLQPVPIGVVGELFLAGEGLARGYLGRPDLTAEKFIADPFALKPGARMYRTGDLGRLRPDGQADFLGRSDHQIKIRGFRVELGEIEAVLRKKVEVAEALVTVRDGKLVAYVEWPAAPSEWKAVLRAHLEEKLPSYMVPALWARIERWPLLPNAKINRKALPPPEVETSAATAAPQGEVEILLAQLWSELLGVPAVGREDNFFALGGDSILSLQVVARAAVAGIKLSAQAVFRHQTLMQLAAVAETVAPVPQAAAPGEVGGAVPLTPIQHWFFGQAFPAHAHWNQSALFMVPAGFDPGRFESALRRVLARHDVFQQRYHRDASGWRVEAGDAAASAQVSAAPWSDFAHACADAQAGLDLATGPLMRAVIFAPPATGGAGRVLLVIHHLAIDGVSWRFLLDELATAYASPQAPLPAVPSTWARWARALVREASSDTTRAELGWWEAISAQPLPRDRPAPGCGRAEAIVTTTLDPADTQRLLQDSATAYRTQVNDLLLTALAQTLARWTGSSGATVALEGHGREEIADGPDIMRTMGWFTTLYPVALSLAGAAGEGDAIKQVKEQLRAVPRRGLGYGLLRYCGEAPVRARLAAHALPELCFNYLGQVDAGAEAAAAGGFSPATESRGADHGPANARAFLIELNAVVAGGALRCDWNYSPAHHDAATIRRLAEDFRAALLRLVAHCVQADAGGLTPSDFPDAQVSQDDLDKLLNRLE